MGWQQIIAAMRVLGWLVIVGDDGGIAFMMPHAVLGWVIGSFRADELLCASAFYEGYIGK